MTFRSATVLVKTGPLRRVPVLSVSWVQVGELARALVVCHTPPRPLPVSHAPTHSSWALAGLMAMHRG